MTPEQTPGTHQATYNEVHGEIKELLKKDKPDEAQGLADTFSKQTRQAVENGEPLTYSDIKNQKDKPGTAQSPVLIFLKTVGES